MNESQIQDFKMWLDGQPDYSSYTRVRTFLAELLDCSNADAEIEMMKLQEKHELKIISKKTGKSGRRVFKRPLEDLTESHIRAVWDGSASVTKDANQIATAVHDMTGHPVPEIKSYMNTLDNAKLIDGSFQWLDDLHDDSGETIR